MSAPLSEQQLAEIRADLDAVPAPPWRWIGVRGSGGPQLVTDHSGRQYLLRAKKPTDSGGDEVLDFVKDTPVYGDLEFRDQRPGEQFSMMRPGDSLAIGRTDYDPDCIVGVDNPAARWMERSAAHAAALLAEVARLQAERHTTNEALSDAAVALRDANTAAGLVAEYHVPTTDGWWLAVRREPNGDRWAIYTASRLILGGRQTWTGDHWISIALATDSELWAYDSADAALAEATRLAETTEAVAS